MNTNFRQSQRDFAAHLRHPDKYPAPAGIEDRRLQIYRDLIYRNIEGFISSAFPVMRSLYDDVAWQQLVRDFVDRHRCATPYFLQISAEFIDYLESERHSACADTGGPADPPFMLELARYEWAELALFVAEDVPPREPLDASRSLLDSALWLSPLAWSMIFSYPVHEIGPGNVPSAPAATPVCLVVYRNRYEQVNFLEINPVTARLLELLEQTGGASGRNLLNNVAAEMPQIEPQRVLDGGAQTLVQLYNLDIILTDHR